MNYKKWKTPAVLISTLFISVAATADTVESLMPAPRPVANSSEFRPHVGLLLGAAAPEGSGTASSEIGIDIGYQPYIPFGIAAEFSHSRIDDGTETRDRNTLWAKSMYNLGGTIPVIKDSYFGLALGAVFTEDRTAFAAAPLIGFDIPLEAESMKGISLGASSRYAVISDGEMDTFSVSGVAKYWY